MRPACLFMTVWTQTYLRFFPCGFPSARFIPRPARFDTAREMPLRLEPPNSELPIAAPTPDATIEPNVPPARLLIIESTSLLFLLGELRGDLSLLRLEFGRLSRGFFLRRSDSLAQRGPAHRTHGASVGLYE